jgi:hypothetical protein
MSLRAHGTTPTIWAKSRELSLPTLLGRRDSQNPAERCLADSRRVRGFATAKKRADIGPLLEAAASSTSSGPASPACPSQAASNGPGTCSFRHRLQRRDRPCQSPPPGAPLGAVRETDVRVAVDEGARADTRWSAAEGGSWSAGRRPSNRLAAGPRATRSRLPGCLFMARNINLLDLSGTRVCRF